MSSVLPQASAFHSFEMQCRCDPPEGASILTHSTSLSNSLATSLPLCQTTTLVLTIIFFLLSLPNSHWRFSEHVLCIRKSQGLEIKRWLSWSCPQGILSQSGGAEAETNHHHKVWPSPTHMVLWEWSGPFAASSNSFFSHACCRHPVTFTHSLSMESLTDTCIKSHLPVLPKEVYYCHPPSTSDVLQALLSHSCDQITLAPLTAHPGGASYMGLITATNESLPLAT